MQSGHSETDDEDDATPPHDDEYVEDGFVVKSEEEEEEEDSELTINPKVDIDPVNILPPDAKRRRVAPVRYEPQEIPTDDLSHDENETSESDTDTSSEEDE